MPIGRASSDPRLSRWSGGLALYLYLPIAAAAQPTVTWGDPTTPAGFIGYVLRSNYGSLSLSLGVKSGSVIGQWVAYGLDLLGVFLVVGVFLAMVGSMRLLRRDPAAAVALGLAFLVAGPLFAAYANPDLSDPINQGILQRFYILPAIPVGILAGIEVLGSLDALIERLGRARPAARPGLAAAALLVMALPVASVAAHGPALDQNGNTVAQSHAEDLLRTLPTRAILLMRGDENYTGVSYVQRVEGFRTDVAAMDVELLKVPAYVVVTKRLHPDVVIPWASYQQGPRGSLKDLVAANIGTHPVFFVGQMAEANWDAAWDEVHAGLVRELVPKGQGGDGYALLRTNKDAIAALSFPDRRYPATTWESLICEHYGVAAFDLAYALQSGADAQAQGPLVEQMYRTAIRLANPTTIPAAFKNLGILLQSEGGDRAEILSLWEQYVALAPEAPDVGQIRQQITRLGGAAP